MGDVDELLNALQRLLDGGATLIVIEHNLHVIKQADWVIDLGPEGGEAAGRSLFEGTPEALAASGRGHTARFLREVLLAPARAPRPDSGEPRRLGARRPSDIMPGSWHSTSFHRRPAIRRVCLVLVACSRSQRRRAAEESFEDLLANLKSPTARTRLRRRQRRSRKSRRREAVAPLSALVRDPEPRVRLEVVDALRQLRDVSAVPALVTSLQDGDPSVREEAISAHRRDLRRARARRPVDALPAGLLGRVRARLGPAVHRRRPGRVPGARRDAARRREGHPGGSRVRDRHPRRPERRGRRWRLPCRTRSPTCAAPPPRRSARWARPTDGKALIPLLADESTDRAAAGDAGGRACCACARPARRCASCSSRTASARWEPRARRAQPDRRPAQADLFRELLASSDPEQRRLAVEGLGRIADKSLLDGFKKDFLREKNSDVRLAYNFAHRPARRPRLPRQHRLRARPARARRRRGRAATCSRSGPAVAPDLYPYLNDPDPQVRGAVCDVLAQLGRRGGDRRLQAAARRRRTARSPTGPTAPSSGCGGDRAVRLGTPERA